MSTLITRTKAKYLAVVYQGVAGVCLLGAVAIGVLGLPESSATAKINSVAEESKTPVASEPTDSSEVAEPNTNAQQETTGLQVDAKSIAARLSMLDNAPKLQVTPDEPVEEIAVEDYTEISQDSAAFMKRIRYTGYIRDSESPLAFLRIDGAQRIIPQGGVAQAGSIGLDDLTIKGVYPTYIVVTDGQTEERIELAGQTGASVTMASGAEIVVSDIPQTMEDVVLTDEQLKELASLPSKRRALREKAMRREALGIEQSKGNTKQPLASFRAGLSDRGGTRRQSPGSPEQD